MSGDCHPVTRLRTAKIEAGMEAANLVLPASTSGEELLHHEDGVDQVSPAVLQPHRAPAGGDDGPGQDAGGPHAATLGITQSLGALYKDNLGGLKWKCWGKFVLFWG